MSELEITRSSGAGPSANAVGGLRSKNDGAVARRLRTKAGLGLSRSLERLRSERGIALPVGVMMLFIVSSIGVAVITSSLVANSQSRQDRSVKRAVAAADAGIDTALYRLNKVVPASNQCVVPEANGLAPQQVLSNGWCPAEEETLGDGARYTYRVSAPVTYSANGQDMLQRTVVSTGTVNGVTRRAAVVAGSASSLFGGYTIISLTKLKIKDKSTVNGDAATNGEFKVEKQSTLCGNGRYGPSKKKKSVIKPDSTQCPGFTFEPIDPPLVLPPVDQGNAPTVNDNGRIGNLDPWTKPQDIQWDPAKRYLKIEKNSTLTLTGNVYSFCHLELHDNADLIIGTRAPNAPPLKIFIDAPENCAGDEKEPVKFEKNAAITNLNHDPTTLQLFVVGSTNKKKKTKVKIGNSFSNVNMVIYAPNSKVEVKDKTHMVGAIAAKEVQIKNKTTIGGDIRTRQLTNGFKVIFQRQSWVECTTRPTNAADPGSGCG